MLGALCVTAARVTVSGLLTPGQNKGHAVAREGALILRSEALSKQLTTLADVVSRCGTACSPSGLEMNG